MLHAQLNLAESWLQSMDTDTLVGAQGTAGMGTIKSLPNKRVCHHTLLRTGLANLSQHLFSGAVVIGGADPHAELLTACHAGHCTAVGGGRAVIGLSSVSLRLHSIRNSSEGRVPGCDQHLRVTLSSCLYVCWQTRSYRKIVRRGKCKLKLCLLLLLFI